MRIMLSQPSSSSLLLSSPETSSREGGDFAAIHNDDSSSSSSRDQSQLPTTTTTTTTTTQRRIASSSLSTLDSSGGCRNETEEKSEETLEGKRALLLLLDGDYNNHHCHHGTAPTIGEEEQHHGATSSSSITTTTRSDANYYNGSQVKNSGEGYDGGSDDGGRIKNVNEIGGDGDKGRWNDWGGGDGDKEDKGKGGDDERSWSSSGASSKFVGKRLLPRERNNSTNAVVPPQEKETTTATTTNRARVAQLQDKDASYLDQEENQEEGEVDDVDGDDIAMGAPSSATTTTITTTTTTAESVKEEINMGDGKDGKDEEDDEENDEEEYSNFMGMDLRRALPMLTESGSTVFDDTYCSSTLANTTYTTSTHTMVVVSCEDEEEDGREEDTTKYSCNESSSGISVRELRRVLPFVEEDDATYSLLDECAESDFEVTSVWSAGAGASAAAAGTSSRAKVGDDVMMEARCGISSKNFVVAGVGRTGIVAREFNHGSNSSGRFASSFPSLMDRYSSLSASASTIAQPPTLATIHQSHMPYSEDEDDDEVENGGEEEEEMREGDSPGHNYNSHTNIHTKVVRNDNDPLMATLSHAIESASINDVEYHQDGDKGDAYATKTRIANGGTTTTMRVMPSPQDHHHQNPHQQQERHLQIHHHHHQIHHHYHYRASPPPPHPVQSLPPPLTSLSTTTLDITAYPLPPPHAIDVVGAGNQDTSINSKLMNNTIKIPVYDDMIVDLERINEEQSSGSVGGGTTATISSRSTNAASRGERRRRERLHQEEELSPAKMLYHPHEPAVLQQQQHQQLPLTSRTTPQLLADQQFFAYRHQYYMEQYHYYDDKKGLAAHGEGMGDIDTSHVSNSQEHSEHDHYDYDNDDDNKYEEETIHSTCSSVTLSQAFHPDGNDVSCSSSLTDEYYHLHPRPPTTDSSLPLPHDGASFGGGVSGVCSTTQRRRRTDIGRATSTISRESSSGSTLSSVTLSRALGRDVNRHEHEHPSGGGGGFYIATRLGDFVQQEEEEEALPSTTAITCHAEESKDEVDTRDGIVDIRTATTTIVKTSNSNIAAAQGKTPTRESPKKQRQHQNKYTSTTSHHQDDFEIETVLSDLSLAGSYKEGGVKNNTNIGDNDKKNINNGVSTQISSTLEEISTDILSSIMPECGVPIPSVMAKVGGRSRGYGMLLPWHSTRSIQNYHRSGSSSSRRVSKKRGGGGGSSDSSTASGRREGNIFSMSSVHTFRG